MSVCFTLTTYFPLHKVFRMTVDCTTDLNTLYYFQQTIHAKSHLNLMFCCCCCCCYFFTLFFLACCSSFKLDLLLLTFTLFLRSGDSFKLTLFLSTFTVFFGVLANFHTRRQQTGDNYRCGASPQVTGVALSLGIA